MAFQIQDIQISTHNETATLSLWDPDTQRNVLTTVKLPGAKTASGHALDQHARDAAKQALHDAAAAL